MQARKAIAAGCIAVGVFAGGVAVGHFVTDDSSSNAKPQVLGQVFARNPDTSTSTTAATLAPVAPPSTQAPTPAPTTTAAPRTSAQTVTLTRTQTTSPPVTTVVVVPNTACGNGTATAKVSSQTFPKTKTADTDYETDIDVAVSNGIDKAIQIDSLAVHLVYSDGGTQDVTFNSAVGNVIQPGVTNHYGVSLNTGKRQVDNSTANGGISLQSFSFHTNGHPECTGRSA